MKNLFLSLLMGISFISCEAQQSFSKEALSETLTDFDGNATNLESTLKKHKGKTVVIEVWASWCGDCVKAMPLLKTMQANNPNVDYVFISMDKAEDKWKAGIEKHEIKGDHYWANDEKMMKGAFGKAIDLDWIPRYIIIDAKGKIVTYRAIEKDFEAMDKTLKSLQ